MKALRLSLIFGALALSLAACSGSTSSNTGAGGNGGGGAPGSASQVVSDGYVASGPWMGYGFTATDPGAATLTPDCSAGSCAPPFAGSTFCMQGTVTGRPDYTGFAMLGWNVNQPAAGDPPLTWPVPDTGGIAVMVTNNPATVALRVQLQGTDPHSSADRWCAPLVSGQMIPWTDFKTNCWQGGTPQIALSAGTMIQQGSIIVPGLLTDLPFDVCLTNIQITP
jgi:hypothetical protein